jgi:phage FluMu gp28-like protein
VNEDSRNPTIRPQPKRSDALSPATGERFFLPYQRDWILDPSSLRIMEKSRQVGITFADAYDSVLKAGSNSARLDVWVSSRDETQARLYLEDCREWARILRLAADYCGTQLLEETQSSAHVLAFANGVNIFCCSSNPNALAGKRGHVKLDEFALHPDQRLLYRVAKPVTTWGGTLSVISTHRGAHTLFNEIIQDARHRGNPMGWSLHTVPIQRAVEQGLVDRINRKTGGNECAEEFLARLRRECIDEEQWLQEYCCVPADESASFFSYDLIAGCQDPGCLRSFDYLESCANPLYLGVDVARKHDLCVLDVGEKIGDITWDRLRLELSGRTFSEIEHELYRLLELPAMVRACIDATGLGMQLAEQARERFGYKVEPISFTQTVKEQLAFGLRADFEDRKLRVPIDDRLTADLRALPKEVSLGGHIRFAGESADSHCDRAWAKALRQHAQRQNSEPGALVA